MSEHICDICGGRAERFENTDFPIEHRGLKAIARNLSGIRCLEKEDCGEIAFDAASAEVYGKVGDGLVIDARKKVGGEIRRIRKRLGLSQKKAAALTGGGHNALSRYETGEVEPMAAVVNLFRLLDADPNLLGKLAPEAA
jgi:HTH-type transcriptional regulator/antitoxin MqsA